jgi:hypothetical protein
MNADLQAKYPNYDMAIAEIERLQAKLTEAAEALERLYELSLQGDFRNGVTDSTGTIDEGDCRASEIIGAAHASLSRLQKESSTSTGRTNDL